MQGCMNRVLFLSFAFFCFSFSSLQAAENPIPNFRQAEPGLLRGGRPGVAGIAFLKAMGVKTIVSLDDDEAENRAEFARAKAAGMQEILLPMSGFWSPQDAKVNLALAALQNPKLRPIFVHCLHGQDRTGLIVGLYRVEAENWAPELAYSEMRQLGFHPELFLLDRYFKERVGL